jgi:hypothetical protein
MSIFSRKSKFVGQPVVINDAGLSLQDRVERAKSRVENLDRKLTLMLRIPKPTSDNLTMIDQTRYSLEEWRKRLKIAEFEMSVYGGDK